MLLDIATSILLALIPPIAEQSSPLEARGKWSIGYEERMCTLGRSFGPPGMEISLMLRPYIGSTEEQLGLVIPARADRRIRQGKGRVILDPGNASLNMSYAIGPLPGPTTRDGVNIDIDIDHDTVRRGLPTASELTVEAGDLRTTLHLTGVPTALKALKACEDDLLRGWGVEPAALIDNAAEPSMVRWFGYNSYPEKALRRRVSGNVIVVADVNADGRATACRIVGSSKDHDLDDGTCQIVLRRAAFSRSSDQLKRYAVIRVNWLIS